jgi:sugar lactone lactonase YvrE
MRQRYATRGSWSRDCARRHRSEKDLERDVHTRARMNRLAPPVCLAVLVTIVACGGKVGEASTNNGALGSATNQGGSGGSGSGNGNGNGNGNGGASAPGEGNAVLDGDFTLLALDDTNLYAAGESGKIVSVAKGDSNAAPAVLVNDEEATGLAVDATYVYWSRLTSGEIVRMPKTGGTPEVIASGQVRPWAVAVDDDRVYWAAEGNAVAGVDTPTGGQVASIAKSGGAITVLAPNEQRPTTLAIDGDTIYFGDGPWGDDNGAIKRVPKAGGTVQTLASGLDILWTLAVANGYVGWTAESGFTQVAIAGGDIVQVPGGVGMGVASDGQRFYYGRPTTDGMELVAVTAGDSNATVLGAGSIASDATRLVANAVASDAAHVFWLDYSWSYAAPDEKSTLRWAARQ